MKDRGEVGNMLKVHFRSIEGKQLEARTAREVKGKPYSNSNRRWSFSKVWKNALLEIIQRKSII